MDFAVPDLGVLADLRPTDLGDVGGERGGVREVELVHGGVDGVVLDRSGDLVAGLLQAEGEPPGAGKQVNGQRATNIDRHGPNLIDATRYGPQDALRCRARYDARGRSLES